jgi:membrane protease YdiL (CAAX protease family)
MIFYLLLLFVFLSYYAYMDWPIDRLFYIENHANPMSMEQQVLVGIFVAFIYVRLTDFVSQRFQWAKNLNAQFAVIFKHTSSLQIAGLALSSAFVEELIFRGCLQQEFGMLISASVFGTLHVPLNAKQIPWTISAILMGFVFALIFEWTGNLIAVTVAHFTINYFNIHALKQLAHGQSQKWSL